MLGEKIREYGFWLADAARGGPVRKYFLDIKKQLASPTDPSSRLQTLMAHAVATTEFYEPFRGCKNVRDFPVVQKNLIKNNYDHFVSFAFSGRRLHTMKTSGSSGERFAALQNREKRQRVLAELIYFNEQCGFHLGDRYLYSRVWFRDNQKSRLVRMAQNMLPFNCSAMSDGALQELAVLLQKDRSIKALKGYATSLGAIADYFDRQGFTRDRFGLKIIVSGAERLEALHKSRLKKVFGCPVVSRYSNQENGILAQQDTQSDIFFLNTAHYFFEFLQLNSDDPAPPGQPARFILTDLYNQAMPFIRYDTGDIVIADVHETGEAHKTILTDVSGRCDEIIYDTRGNKISPHAVALHFRQFDRVSLFQIAQDSRTQFTLRLEGGGVYDDKILRQSLESLLGKDAAVEIVHMDSIPRAASGKFRKVICNCEE